mmetsp:Transcript_23028/g.50399  ORF Transcript_23028/g.50399 Transcript_23028/m.50399 type:complete len:217 (-) Transcript_23028:160-810(-)
MARPTVPSEGRSRTSSKSGSVTSIGGIGLLLSEIGSRVGQPCPSGPRAGSGTLGTKDGTSAAALEGNSEGVGAVCGDGCKGEGKAGCVCACVTGVLAGVSGRVVRGTSSIRPIVSWVLASSGGYGASLRQRARTWPSWRPRPRRRGQNQKRTECSSPSDSSEQLPNSPPPHVISAISVSFGAPTAKPCSRTPVEPCGPRAPISLCASAASIAFADC